MGLQPGDEQTLTITVDDAICPDGPLFSMASMLGEFIVHTTRFKPNRLTDMFPRGSTAILTRSPISDLLLTVV